MVMIAAGADPVRGILLVLAVLVMALAIISIARGMDVRLVLLLAAFSLAGLAGDVTPIIREFLSTFSNERFVVPICSAMGFAYVLRHTRCDQHLVHLLIKPLQRFRLFVIPGVVLVGFLVNIPVISQTSTAVCIGAVVVPLMRAVGISSLTIGASILLGASIGGELLNPGAPELNTVAENQHQAPGAVVPAVMRLIFYHLAIATAIFWWLSVRAERTATVVADAPLQPLVPFRVNIFCALVPLFPLIFLFLTGPPLEIIKVPTHWIVDEKTKALYGTRLIGLAMLLGVLLAAFAAPRQVAHVPRSFFEGAGYAFATIVSIIVTANCFGAAIKLIGLSTYIERLIVAMPDLLLPRAAAVSMAFAALSGSGMASTQSLYALFVEPAEALNIDRIDLGALISISAASGRTMSPVAAVTLMCAAMTQTRPFALARRVAVPLLSSGVVVIALRMLKLI